MNQQVKKFDEIESSTHTLNVDEIESSTHTLNAILIMLLTS